MFIFLVFLLLAVQVVFTLYARSVVTAAAYDGARVVAGFDPRTDPDATQQRAEDHARRLLGRYGERAGFDWRQTDDDTVVLTVAVETPSFLPTSMRRPLRLDRTVRTVRVHREKVVQAS